MTIKKLPLLLGFAAFFPAPAAFASGGLPATVTTTVSGTTDTVDRGYAGLEWTLGEGLTPAVVVGYRHARVQSNGDTQGGDISFSFNVISGFHPGKLRAKYFNGQENVQGEVGGGFDFAKGVFAGVGVQGPYTNLGVDYLFTTGSPWEPYFMLNTLPGYDKPHGNTTTTMGCPTGYTLSGSSCFPIPSDRRLKRSIRLLAKLNNGIKIYAFKYLWSDIVYVGVMAQDLLQHKEWRHAVTIKANGFYAVDYAMLGLKMATLNEWKEQGLASVELNVNPALSCRPVI